MRAYARKLGDDEELWGVTGLLHDADYERFPDMDDTERRPPADDHGRTSSARDAPRRWSTRSPAHADFLGVPRETDMAKTLFAVDELSGFLVACAYVRPEGIHGMTPKSVKKKLKTPAFAAAVNRDDVREGAEELGVDFDEHVAFVIAALEERADELEPPRQRAEPPLTRGRARALPRGCSRAPHVARAAAGRRSPARLPIGINGLAIVLFLREHDRLVRGGRRRGGGASAPARADARRSSGRLIDRLGQRRTVLAARRWPHAAAMVALVVCGLRRRAARRADRARRARRARSSRRWARSCARCGRACCATRTRAADRPRSRSRASLIEVVFILGPLLDALLVGAGRPGGRAARSPPSLLSWRASPAVADAAAGRAPG